MHSTDPLVEAQRLWHLSRNGLDTGTNAAAAINGVLPVEGEEATNATAPEPEDPIAAVAE